MTAYETEQMERGIREWKAEQTAAGMPHQRKVFDSSTPLIQQVMREAAVIFGVDEDELYGPSHAYRLADARKAAWLVLRSEANVGVMQLGRVCLRDHSTVRHGVVTAQQKAATDRDYAAKVERIRQHTMGANEIVMERAA